MHLWFLKDAEGSKQVCVLLAYWELVLYVPPSALKVQERFVLLALRSYYRGRYMASVGIVFPDG